MLLIELLIMYFDFTHVFLPKLPIKLLEEANINNHTIKLVNNRQFYYSPIYSLGLVELKLLKT